MERQPGIELRAQALQSEEGRVPTPPSLLKPPKPQFSLLLNGDNNSTCLLRGLRIRRRNANQTLSIVSGIDVDQVT